MRIGDRVLYIYNKPYEGNLDLNGAIGTIDIIDGTYHVRWISKRGYRFGWWVPKNHIRKIKPSDLS